MHTVDPVENVQDYDGFRIKVIHAFCAVDPEDNSEGIGGFMTPNGPLPMIASDAVRLEQLKKIAQDVSNRNGMTYKIVRFSVREDIGEIKPMPKPKVGVEETGG